MQYYIRLQYRLLKRHIEDLGVPFLAAPVLFAIVWVLFFRLIDQYPNWAPYVLVLVNIYVCVPLSDPDRNDFLKLLFKRQTYQQVRLYENLLIALPFVLLALVKGLPLFAFASLLTSTALSLLNFRMTTGRAMPAPFTKYPYEGQLFFRRFWWLLALMYLIAFMGLISDNFNLVFFAAAVLIFFFGSVIDHREPSYYVWVYSKKPEGFLWQKTRRLLIQLTILLAPIYIGLFIRFPHIFYITILVWVFSFMVLATTVVMVYRSFPRPMSLPMSMLMGFCFIFPPLCLLVFPVMYRQAILNLKKIL